MNTINNLQIPIAAVKKSISCLNHRETPCETPSVIFIFSKLMREIYLLKELLPLSLLIFRSASLCWCRLASGGAAVASGSLGEPGDQGMVSALGLRSAATPWTGLKTGLPSAMPAQSPCGGGQRHAPACVRDRVSVCE